ncbi:hypothetical protein M8756_03085 [Lutimaribacter sp. EGI FJ00015]|uniref:Uncharacterized protein n=1 Tax=Lutimaribacter degradans TaxID=2945989 RepID=A0ACC5ZRQ9_9RHOB|nr:hypothetical protein [Lutimaribacter sp. EGI FJ00013]MCM2560772.1 hypothetical protein [Lutimaribacter sp. EGI FJ00013]MCO0612282.1 hypothetical protein [Lutimaribacter sp. EGI FJ00015]MCO0634597.1 hypothetical protein [Lutimaribacter sp. EGI FJ00014]
MWLERMKTGLRGFRDDLRGVVAVESIIVLPLLFWALLAMYAFFDAYRQAGLNIKAAYTIGDLLSRETNYVTDDYLDTTHQLFDLMTRSQSNSKLRVTVVKWNESDQRYQRDWSKTRGGIPELTNTDVKNLAEKLPDMPDGERVIVVETWARYAPPFKVGIDEQDLYNFVFTRPRFAPQLVWKDGI